MLVFQQNLSYFVRNLILPIFNKSQSRHHRHPLPPQQPSHSQLLKYAQPVPIFQQELANNLIARNINKIPIINILNILKIEIKTFLSFLFVFKTIT